MYAAANTNFLLIGAYIFRKMKHVHQEEALINRSFTIKASNDSEPTLKKNCTG